MPQQNTPSCIAFVPPMLMSWPAHNISLNHQRILRKWKKLKMLGVHAEEAHHYIMVPFGLSQQSQEGEGTMNR